MPIYYQNLTSKWLLSAVVLLGPLAVQGVAPLFQLVAPGILVIVTKGLSLGVASSIIGWIFAVGVLLCLLGKAPEALVWLIQTAGLAMVFVVAGGQRWPAIKTLLAGFICLSVIFITALSIGSGQSLVGGYDRVVQAISQDLEQSLAIYMDTSADAYQAEAAAWFQWFKSLIIRFLPSMIALVFLIINLSNILLAKTYLARTQGVDIFGPEFTQWRLPYPLVWVMIAAGLSTFLGKGACKFAGENVLPALAGLYFLQGLAIISFYFGRLKVPIFIRWATYILLSIHWCGLLMIVILGLSDVWFDFRAKAPSADQS